MWQDPIVAEIHQIRDNISEAYGDDLHAIFAAAQRGELVKPRADTAGDSLRAAALTKSPTHSSVHGAN